MTEIEYTWKGPYKRGEIRIRSTSFQELDEQVERLQTNGEGPASSNYGQVQVEMPRLEGVSGCSDAVRTALASEWGRREPRGMAELQHVFGANALFFSLGTLSGVLNYLTRSGEVRRLEKGGRWAYTLVR